MKVVLDTNSLLVSIGRQSKYRPIFDALLKGKIKLLITNEIAHEYLEKIAEKANDVVAENILNLLLRSPDVEQVQVYFRWSLIHADADDNKFVDCALNGQAQYLVTDDKHFNVLNQIGFPPVRVIKTAAFLEEVQKLA